VPDDFEPAIIEQVLDVLSAAGEEVVQADDVMAFCQEPFAEV